MVPIVRVPPAAVAGSPAVAVALPSAVFFGVSAVPQLTKARIIKAASSNATIFFMIVSPRLILDLRIIYTASPALSRIISSLLDLLPYFRIMLKSVRKSFHFDLILFDNHATEQMKIKR